jgi:AcrR family transcriptional regulator
VDAAAELMRARGVANTSLDAVLAASAANKSQLYHYFADKDDLVLAVVQRQTECVLAAQEAYLRKATSLAGLRRWRDALVELSRQLECAGGCPLGSLVSELAEAPRPRAALSDSFARWEALIVRGFARIRARSEPAPDVDLADLATAMLAALQGGLLLAQTARSTRPLELALDMAIAHVAVALRKADAPRTREHLAAGEA